MNNYSGDCENVNQHFEGTGIKPNRNWIAHSKEEPLSCKNENMVLKGARNAKCEDGVIVYDGEEPSCVDEEQGNP